MEQKIFFMEGKVLMVQEDTIQKNQEMIVIIEMDLGRKAPYFQTKTMDLQKQKMTEDYYQILKNYNKN